MPPIVLAPEPPQTDIPDYYPSFGRIEAPDERDQNFRLRSLVTATAPVIRRRRARVHMPPQWYGGKHRLLPESFKIDPRKAPTQRSTVWRDQGNRSSCTQHALEHRLLGQPWPRPVWALQYPQHKLYELAQTMDEWPGGETPEARKDGGGYYEGTSSRAICRAAREVGLIESWWNAESVDEALDYILNDTPDPRRTGGLLFGTDWTQNMMNLVNGYVEPNFGVSRTVGGHEWYCYGASLKDETFYCLNSWSYMGPFKIRFSAVGQMFARGGDSTAIVEASYHTPLRLDFPEGLVASR